MKKNITCLPGLIAVGAVWFGLTAWCFTKPAGDFSDSERRPLAQFPEVTVESTLSGKFMSDFETYTLDQFPLRDGFRTFKALSAFYAFGKKDNNDIYIKDGYAAKIEYPLNENSVSKAGDKLTSLYEKYIADTGANVYFSIVPDKGYFLAEKNGYPAMDYDKMVADITGKLTFAQYIDIMGELKITDYYKTDTHWKQESILGVADKITASMGVSGIGEHDVVKTDVPFYGVYYGQAALPLPGEDISYVTNDILGNCTVNNIETGKTYNGTVDFDKADGKDPYEMFLSGAVSVLEITNPAGIDGKELIVFRDSFGSSLIPLLLRDYSKVTVLDTRYIHPSALGNFVDFSKADDVLFIYSTGILNQSETLR